MPGWTAWDAVQTKPAQASSSGAGSGCSVGMLGSQLVVERDHDGAQLLRPVQDVLDPGEPVTDDHPPSCRK
jgi:hypothetical protein